VLYEKLPKHVRKSDRLCDRLRLKAQEQTFVAGIARQRSALFRGRMQIA
jgi:hypothetical protein